MKEPQSHHPSVGVKLKYSRASLNIVNFLREGFPCNRFSFRVFFVVKHEYVTHEDTQIFEEFRCSRVIEVFIVNSSTG